MSSTTSTPRPVDGNRRQGRDGATSCPVMFDMAGWKSRGCHPQRRRSTLLGCRRRARRPLGKLEGGRGGIGCMSWVLTVPGPSMMVVAWKQQWYWSCWAPSRWRRKVVVVREEE